jgi:DNA-binding transcriptional MerR regulator
MTQKPILSVTASMLAEIASRELGGAFGKITERTVRFYTSQGILSKPLRDGDDKRQALYGYRQLIQLKYTLVLSRLGVPLPAIKDKLADAYLPQAELQADKLVKLQAMIDEIINGKETPNELS